MNLIEDYEFGKIIVNGKIYTRDLIIMPSKIIENWWRKEGHRVQIEDLKEIMNEEISYFIIGIGYYDRVEVDNEVIEFFKKRDIKLLMENSKRAVEDYNILAKEGKKVAIGIHLTC